jgi:hypothetical protein
VDKETKEQSVIRVIITIGKNLVQVSNKKGQLLLLKSKNWLFVKSFSTVEWDPPSPLSV